MTAKPPTDTDAAADGVGVGGAERQSAVSRSEAIWQGVRHRWGTTAAARLDFVNLFAR
jgi:hypothetical protein